MMLFILLYTEGPSAFRLLWMRGWFRVAFWIALWFGVALMVRWG